MAQVIQGRGPWRPGGKPLINARANVRANAAPANSLLAQAQQLANLQTQGPLQQLAQQLAASQRQTAGTMKLAGGYYNTLGQQAAQGVTAEQGIANDLNSQLQAIAGRTNSQLQGLGQNAQSSLLAHSPQGDGGLATSALAGLTADIARQQGLAAQQQGASQAFGATQGANYSGLAATGQGTNALAATQALRGIAQSGTVKNQPLLAQVANLQAQHGALVATNLGKLQQQQTNNAIAEAGLNLKGQALTQAQQQANARNALTARGQDITARGQNITNANNLANQALHAAQLNERAGNDAANQALKQAALNLKASTTGRGKARILTPSQQNYMYRSLDEMAALIPQAQQAGHKEPDIKKALAAGQLQKGFGPQSAVMIEAAYELLGWGHITGPTARAMRGMGLRGGTFRGKPIQVAPPPGGLKGIGVGGLAGTLKSIGNAL